MRCYMCDGRGMRYDGFQNLYRTCEKCGGSGIAEPLTNEEWLRQASTEQLAEEIVKMTLLDVYKLYDRMEAAEYEHGIGIGAKKVIVEWLKEMHHG